MSRAAARSGRPAAPPEVVYLDPGDPAPPQPFRTGEAGLVWLTPGGDVETEPRVVLSANSTHALIGHGVAERLDALPLEYGPLLAGKAVLVPPPALEAASQILYDADRNTYGRTWEFVVAQTSEREHRVRVA